MNLKWHFLDRNTGSRIETFKTETEARSAWHALGERPWDRVKIWVEDTDQVGLI